MNKKIMRDALIECVANLASTWITTCGAFWIVCWGFNMDFSLRLATGVWAAVGIAKSIVCAAELHREKNEAAKKILNGGNFNA